MAVHQEHNREAACVVGVDFDNTLVSYERALRRCVEALRLPIPADATSKRAIRDRIRLMPDGEATWQRVQAHIYGDGMRDAELMPGARAFLDDCAKRGIPLHVVSHKTEFATARPGGPNLRDAALSWIRQQGLLDGRAVLTQDHIHFEATRAGKIDRLCRLACTHFIDDLEETFLEESFPAGVVKILFDPGKTGLPRQGWLQFDSWAAINAHFAGACRHV